MMQKDRAPCAIACWSERGRPTGNVGVEVGMLDWLAASRK